MEDLALRHPHEFGPIQVNTTRKWAISSIIDFDQLIVEDSITPSGRGNVTGLTNATLDVNFNGVTFQDLAGNTIDILLSANDLSAQSFGS